MKRRMAKPPTPKLPSIPPGSVILGPPAAMMLNDLLDKWMEAFTDLRIKLTAMETILRITGVTDEQWKLVQRTARIRVESKQAGDSPEETANKLGQYLLTMFNGPKQ